MPRPGAGGSEVYFGKTGPLSPEKGDFWYDTSATTLNFHNGVSWLAVAVSAGQFDTLSNSISVLSQAVSVISQAQSVVSAAVSVLSQAVSVLSQTVSVLSQAQSVLSQAVSVLSQKVSVLSVAVDTISNAVSVLSQQVSVLSQSQSVLSQALSVLSQAFSALSAGLGTVQLRTASNAQVISGTTTTKISGLSVSCGASGIYEIAGKILYNMSVANGVLFNLSGNTSTLVMGARLTGGQAISSREVANQQGFPWQISLQPTTVSIFVVTIDGIINTSAAVTLQAFAWASAAGADINIKKGSFLRAYKIG